MTQQMRNQINVQDLKPDQLASVKDQLSQELMNDTSRVMLDVGTGYLIDQPASTAKKLLNQKALLLSVNLDQFQSTIETKQENLSLENELIQIKLNSSNNSNK
ncbi:putative prefoldin subunit 5 [Phakopsora pachyrhizi]|nr:putative prefoldin subunit 5 [Phakopsora pachyrhizi]KAI8452747.1 putative prefoldin subunit 5 [Phakopsora pachyrhizi]KAI8455241.1 putative prefoldin subunit 5 [Phakopsora pachyrhizi]